MKKFFSLFLCLSFLHFRLYLFFFAKLQVLKFEFFHIKAITTAKLAINWQKFAEVGLQYQVCF